MSTGEDQGPKPVGGSDSAPPPPGRLKMRARRPAQPPSRVKPRKSGDNPFADMYLAKLKQEIDAKAPTDVLGVELTRAADRIERKRLATKAPFVADARHVSSGLRGVEDLPLEMAFESGLDPREEDPSFRALSPEEQDQMRQHWAVEQQKEQLRPRQARKEQVILFVSALAVFLAVAVVLLPFEGLGAMPGLLLMGAVTGMLWTNLRRTRFAFALAGTLVFAIGKGFSYAIGTSDFSQFAEQSLTLLFTAAAITLGCGIVGFDCEMRHSGGFRQG